MAAAAPPLRILTYRPSVKDAHERRASFSDGRQVEILKGGAAAAAAALAAPKIMCAFLRRAVDTVARMDTVVREAELPYWGPIR